MSRRPKTATPGPPADHPALELSYVDEEIKANLLKTPVALLLEQENYKTQLKELRNDWHYAWVLQWLYYFRGAIKLSGDPFSVDLVEEELVGLTEPNLINKIPTGLAAALLGTKVTIEDFSFRARFLLGDGSTSLGTEEDPVEYTSLSLVNKFEVLYSLIQQLQYTDIYRVQIDKYENPSELRFEPIYEDSTVAFYLLSDSRIYKRTILAVPELKIPRKYKYAKLLNPEVDFPEVDPEIKWELVAIGIYQIHDFLISLKSDKKMKLLFENIKTHINELAQEDLNTRKKILKRKRDQTLTDLLSNRKRSSRLVQKEEQHKQELAKQQEQQEILKKQQEKARMHRKYKLKLNVLKRDIEERLKRQTHSRKLGAFEEVEPSSLEGIELGEGEWLFDCYCGIKEKNYDDGIKMVVCENCQRWQHLKCQDRAVRQDLATKADEVLICKWCMQEIENEIAAKLEAERLVEEEAEKERERQKEIQREIHRKKMEEDRKRLDEQERLLEEAEKLRKEEMERERQRRFIERQNAVAVSVSSDSDEDETVKDVQAPAPAPAPVQAQVPVQTQTQQTQVHAPTMGTFHSPMTASSTLLAQGPPPLAQWGQQGLPHLPTGQFPPPQFQQAPPPQLPPIQLPQLVQLPPVQHQPQPQHQPQDLPHLNGMINGNGHVDGNANANGTGGHLPLPNGTAQ